MPLKPFNCDNPDCALCVHGFGSDGCSLDVPYLRREKPSAPREWLYGCFTVLLAGSIICGFATAAAVGFSIAHKVTAYFGF